MDFAHQSGEARDELVLVDAELAAALQFTTQAALQRYLGDLIDLQQLEVTAVDATLSVTVAYVIRATQQQQLNTFVRSAS